MCANSSTGEWSAKARSRQRVPPSSACRSSISPTTRSTTPRSLSSPSPCCVATRCCRSAVTAIDCSSPWSTRATCSRSTTSAPPSDAGSPRRRRARRPARRPRPVRPLRQRDQRAHRRDGRGERPRPADLVPVTEAAEEDAPIVRFVNLLITQAIQDHASDIHIEPGEHQLDVRYRIDGVLHQMQTAPKSIQNGVISRLKIMSDIDIAERRSPQDGRMSVVHGGPRSTSVSRRCRRCTARRSSCESSTTRRRLATSATCTCSTTTSRCSSARTRSRTA